MGITDGTYICKLCGEWMTGCSLCGQAPLIDNRENLRRQEQAERDGERELWRQSQAIRNSANSR